MPWWVWITIGVLLLGSELTFVDAGFYLVFLGIAALATGALAFTGVGFVPWMQWITFSLLAVASMFLFRRPLYERVHGGTSGLDDPLIGATVIAQSSVAVGASGRAELHGSTWSITNDGPAELNSGDSAVVTRVDGLALHVRRRD